MKLSRRTKQIDRTMELLAEYYPGEFVELHLQSGLGKGIALSRLRDISYDFDSGKRMFSRKERYAIGFVANGVLGAEGWMSYFSRYDIGHCETGNELYDTISLAGWFRIRLWFGMLLPWNWFRRGK
jgi:hypothetical protein